MLLCVIATFFLSLPFLFYVMPRAVPLGTYNDAMLASIDRRLL
jgi:hypothetical protein